MGGCVRIGPRRPWSIENLNGVGDVLQPASIDESRLFHHKHLQHCVRIGPRRPARRRRDHRRGTGRAVAPVALYAAAGRLVAAAAAAAVDGEGGGPGRWRGTGRHGSLLSTGWPVDGMVGGGGGKLRWQRAPRRVRFARGSQGHGPPPQPGDLGGAGRRPPRRCRWRRGAGVLLRRAPGWLGR